jgi:hypothetical protein
MARKSFNERRLSARKKIAGKGWNSLSFRQKESRLRALEALNLMKKGKSMTLATMQVGITQKSFKRHVGSAINRTASGKWNAKSHDRISRVMTIFSKGKRFNIETRSSRTASIIGRYNSAVGHYAQTGNASNLRNLEGVVVKDANAKTFLLETRPKKVIAILEGLESPDVPTVYAI